MSLPIALQLYSVREDFSADMAETLKKVREMGYQGVELAGIYGYSPQEIRTELDNNQLTAISAHIPFTDLIGDTGSILKDYAQIGCKYIVIPYLTEEYRPGSEGFGKFLELAKELGRTVNEHGMTLLYHNHDFEFVKIGDTYGLDLLYQEIPAELIQTEIDTCWVKVAGEDPVPYLKKYSGRAPLVHLKDFHIQGQPDKLYELIGLDSEEAENTGGSFELRPLGKGVQDIPALLKTAAEIGSNWVIIEQDEPTPGMTAMECARQSLDYLKSL